MPSSSPTRHTASTTHAGPQEHGLNGSKLSEPWIRWKDVQEWWSDLSPFEWDVLIASTCLKVLLFPS